MSRSANHYDYLEAHLPAFFEAVGVSGANNAGIISAHGDKAYSYRHEWEKLGIPFNHGVALYLLSYCRPFDLEVRQTAGGWVAPKDWVASNYERFSYRLP